MYPISLDVRDRRVVVLGGGAVAERKVRGLLDAGAAVTLIAPTCTAALQAEAARASLEWHARPFEPSDLDGAMLVFAAVDDDAVNARISELARERGIPINDAGDAARGDFITPAVHRTGDLTIAVETGGASPALAMRIREELRERYDESYARATVLLAHMRDYAAIITDSELRSRVLRELACLPIEELAAMNAMQAEHVIDEAADASCISRMPVAYVCATRASALALWQTRSIMAKLATAGIASTMLHITTKGDHVQDRALVALGTDSVFVKELENALRDRRADYAVHSCKDLPSALPEDMRLAAIGAREDPRDVFCSEHHQSFETLPHGATVGTSSPRRRAQLQALRPDLRYVAVRGNIDTRLRKLREGECDAIILAAAGLNRLHLRARHTVPFDLDVIIPAVGQGALAIECRLDDRALGQALHATLSDPISDITVRAERAFLRQLQAGCQAPVGAYAAYDGTLLRIRGIIAEHDGSRIVRGEKSARVRDAQAAERLGERLADELAEQGGADILNVGDADQPLRNIFFLLPRTQERSSRIAPALRGAGALVFEVKSGDEAASLFTDRYPDVLLFPSSGSVETISLYLAALREQGARPLVAAMGEASASAATKHGFAPHIVASNPSVAAFVQSVAEFILAEQVSK
jgi:hydroxymethylbilane synthase